MVRESLWVGGSAGEVTLAAANTASLLRSANATLLGLRPFTVVRNRGWLMVRSDQTAASESQQVGYGLCVVSDQAVAIGVTAVPTPATDLSSGLWLVYESITNHLQVTPAGTGPSNQVKSFDSRAMRKVEEGQDLITVAESYVTSSGLILFSVERTLIKLH